MAGSEEWHDADWLRELRAIRAPAAFDLHDLSNIIEI
jgi:hypothetical protein